MDTTTKNKDVSTKKGISMDTSLINPIGIG